MNNKLNWEWTAVKSWKNFKVEEEEEKQFQEVGGHEPRYCKIATKEGREEKENGK